MPRPEPRQKTKSGLKIDKNAQPFYPQQVGVRPPNYPYYESTYSAPNRMNYGKLKIKFPSKIGEYIWAYEGNLRMSPANVGKVMWTRDEPGHNVRVPEYKAATIFQCLPDGSTKQYYYKTGETTLTPPDSGKYLCVLWGTGRMQEIPVERDTQGFIVITEKQYKEVLHFAKARKFLRILRGKK